MGNDERQLRHERLRTRNRAEHAALHLSILTAAARLPASIAPQQSSSSRHSKPRSFASRMVVCTHTSVEMPVSTMLRMPRCRRMSSRSVAQNELVGHDLAGRGRNLRDDFALLTMYCPPDRVINEPYAKAPA